jgi:hypothetical protein
MKCLTDAVECTYVFGNVSFFVQNCHPVQRVLSPLLLSSCCHKLTIFSKILQALVKKYDFDAGF